MATRNPVSVLPVPVGDATRTSLPSAMCRQAATCGAVGPSGKRRANHAATAGWNRSTIGSGVGEAVGGATVVTPLFHQDAVTDVHTRCAVLRRGARPPPRFLRAGGAPRRRSSEAG